MCGGGAPPLPPPSLVATSTPTASPTFVANIDCVVMHHNHFLLIMLMGRLQKPDQNGVSMSMPCPEASHIWDLRHHHSRSCRIAAASHRFEPTKSIKGAFRLHRSTDSRPNRSHLLLLQGIPAFERSVLLLPHRLLHHYGNHHSRPAIASAMIAIPDDLQAERYLRPIVLLVWSYRPQHRQRRRNGPQLAVSTVSQSATSYLQQYHSNYNYQFSEAQRVAASRRLGRPVKRRRSGRLPPSTQPSHQPPSPASGRCQRQYVHRLANFHRKRQPRHQQ